MVSTMTHDKHGYLPDDALLFEIDVPDWHDNGELLELVDNASQRAKNVWRRRWWPIECVHLDSGGYLGLFSKSEIKPLTREAKALYETL